MQRMQLRSRQWLEDEKGNIIMGEGRQRIFQLIEETGSINKAAIMINMSYRGVWVKSRPQRSTLRKKS